MAVVVVDGAPMAGQEVGFKWRGFISTLGEVKSRNGISSDNFRSEVSPSRTSKMTPRRWADVI
jgi:hypothetical protein